MNETTEILKIHGFTSLSEMNTPVKPGNEEQLIEDINAVLPGTMFAVYDASSDNPGYYVVEHKEISSYTEA